MADRRIDEFNAWAARDGWSTRVDGDLQFRSPRLREAHAVWTRAAAGDPLPSRAELTPRAMKSFLPNVVIWDVLRGAAANRYRLRVMGTALETVWGCGETGGLLDEDVAEPFRTRWQRIADLSLALCKPLRCHGAIQYGNRTYYESETFQAPLAGEDGAPGAILFVHIVGASVASHDLAVSIGP